MDHSTRTALIGRADEKMKGFFPPRGENHGDPGTQKDGLSSETAHGRSTRDCAMRATGQCSHGDGLRGERQGGLEVIFDPIWKDFYNHYRASYLESVNKYNEFSLPPPSLLTSTSRETATAGGM